MTDAPSPTAVPRIYTVPPGVAFVDALAGGLLARIGDDAAALADMRILLPTRRACRVLAEAFLRHAGGRPLLLPRISPVGDVDEDDLGLDIAPDDDIAVDPGVPPAISPVRRQLLLMRLILADPSREATPEQAARLAAELGRLLDQAIIEGVELTALSTLVPERYAGHWQTTLRFLTILTEHWPAILATEGCIDAADRRNRLLAAAAAGWTARPPATPVIAAGSTGSIPATAALLAVVSRLPRGAVVLPGLDREADDAVWDAVDATHPQYAMARLLERIGLERREVATWPSPIAAATPPARASLVNRALRPAAAAGLAGEDSDAAAVAGVTRIDAAGPAEEARAVALILREALEGEGRTAALVTPDRGLARRVAGELRRWDIAVDDSAGIPLAATAPFVLLRLAVRMVADAFAPVALLAALKHPLAGGGAAPGALRRRVRRLERTALRGPRPAPGLDGLRAAVARRIAARRQRAATAEADAALAARERDLAALIDEIETLAAPLAAIAGAGDGRLAGFVAAHATVAEALAASDDRTGAERLWSGEAGEAAAAFLRDLAEQSDGVGLRSLEAYADLLDALALGRVVRPRYGRHPRLFIWGPLEARLQHADVTILGGLNEGTWPPRVPAGPWMSRPMMQACGLPLPERRIGLSAHDFVQAFCAPRVYLTRARRAEGTPTVACRWLLRLDAALAADPAVPSFDDGRIWLDWQHALDDPGAVLPGAPPAPCPPVAARPRRLSVTQIETWMRDPYAVYARHVLGLAALEPLEKALGPSDFGDFVHRAIHVFLAGGDGASADALARLLAAGRQALGNDLQRSEIRAFWWPRFERLAAWLVAHERDRAAEIARIVPEVEGRLEIAVAGGPFTLVARADRIEIHRDGGLAVIDYKTGAPPTSKQVAAGFSPQLPLEGAMAEHGAFAGIAAGPIAALDYWRLGGGREPGKVSTAGEDPKALADDALAGLKALIARFDLVETPYEARPRPAYAPPFSDYEHLERVREWAAVGGEDET